MLISKDEVGLPGEWLYTKDNGNIYRWERRCLDCEYREYLDTRTHNWVPVNNQ